MRRWRVAGLVTLAIAMSGVVPAAGQEPAPPGKALPADRPPVDQADLVPIPEEGSSAPSRSAAAILPSPCYQAVHNDPDEPSDSFLDADRYWLKHGCESATWELAVRTIDSWPIEELLALEIDLDTDRNFNTGCGGFDFFAFAGFDPSVGDVVGGLFRTPGCETDPILVSSALMWAKPTANSIELTFPGSPFIGSSTFRWGGLIFAHDPNDLDVDFIPDLDTLWSAPGNPCGGHCFFLKNALAGGAADVFFKDDQPASQVVVGDWNADGVDSFGFRNGRTLSVKNDLSAGPPAAAVTSGLATDKVLVGDWDGDGDDTFALRRGNTFFIKNSLTGGAADVTFTSGLASDTVLVGDWDGDGDDTFAFRRGTTFFVRNFLSAGPANVTFSSGLASDTVLAGDWNGEGHDTFGFRRGRANFLKNTLGAGAADVTFSSGLTIDTPHAGDWNADNSDTLGLRR